jgi:Arc/MetJ-type ribon-helix-helix transcriptional regulator
MGDKMGRIKPRGRYMAISVPISLHKEITDFVKKSSYNSVAEFVKFAVREKMKEDKLEDITKGFGETIELSDEEGHLHPHKLVHRHGKVMAEEIPQYKKFKELEEKVNEILVLLKKKKNNDTNGFRG